MRNIKHRVLTAMNGKRNVHYIHTERWLHYNHDPKFMKFQNSVWGTAVPTFGVGLISVIICIIICLGTLYSSGVARGNGEEPSDSHGVVIDGAGYCALWMICAVAATFIIAGLVIATVLPFYTMRRKMYTVVERELCDSTLGVSERYFRDGVRNFVDACYKYKCKFVSLDDLSVWESKVAGKLMPCVEVMTSSGQAVLEFLEAIESDVAGWEFMLAPVMIAMQEIGTAVRCEYHVGDNCSNSVLQKHNIAKNAQLMRVLCLISIRVLEFIEGHERDDDTMQKLRVACEKYSSLDILSDASKCLAQVWVDAQREKRWLMEDVRDSKWLRNSVLPRLEEELILAQYEENESVSSEINGVGHVGEVSSRRIV